MSVLDFLSAELCSTHGLIALIAFLLACYWYRRPDNFPPGPRGVPLLGVVPFVGRYPERHFMKWSQKYGPVMSVRMGSADFVVLNDLDSIQAALVKKKEQFSGRPKIPVIEQITQGHGVVFIDYNDLWKSQRRFGLSTLRGFGVGKRGMEERVQEEVYFLCQAVLQHEGKPFNIMGELANAVSNNICSVVMGQRFDYNDEVFKRTVGALGDSFADPIGSLITKILMFAPSLIHFPPFSTYNNRLMDDVRLIVSMLRGVIAEHKETYDPENHRDFIDAFISHMDTNSDFTEIQLLQYVRDLFVAGTETTTSTLRWSILAMIHYPRTQKKLSEEIRRVVGTENTALMSNKADMPYTSAFIEEIYRFRTLLPLNIPHLTHEDVELNGYHIPKNVQVICNLWAVHNNPQVFKKPEVFDPERHLDQNGRFVKSNHVIPFSVGPRHCLGEQLARMEVFIFLVSLVQKFEFKPNPLEKKLPEIVNGSSGAAFVPLKFQVVAEER